MHEGTASAPRPRSGNHHGPFGDDAFGRCAERIARFFGTPGYLAAQSAVVAAWIALNAVAVGFRWDPYPFILLNLAFSTQAAYAAPLILLAQTRQADRDKVATQEADERHRKLERHQEHQGARMLKLLEANTTLTQQTEALAEQIAQLTEGVRALLPPEPRGDRR